jgi:hypothetical protein
MSTAETDLAHTRETIPLQTFIAPSDAYPIALSVLWISIPPVLERSPQYSLLKFTQAGILSWSSLGTGSHVVHFLHETIENEITLDKFHSAFNTFVSTAFVTDRINFKRPGHETWSKDYRARLRHYRGLLKNAKMYSPDPEWLLQSSVVIRKSPPTDELLGKILSTASTIGVAGYAGLQIAPQGANPVLLLALVAGGIIIISTAAGIGRALQDGIYERLYSLLKGSSGKGKEDHDKLL